MVLQPVSGTPARVTTHSGGLLPRLFTLTATGTRPSAAVILCYLELCPPGHLPVRKHGALCCPDFPLPRIRIPTRPVRGSDGVLPLSLYWLLLVNGSKGNTFFTGFAIPGVHFVTSAEQSTGSGDK